MKSMAAWYSGGVSTVDWIRASRDVDIKTYVEARAEAVLSRDAPFAFDCLNALLPFPPNGLGLLIPDLGQLTFVDTDLDTSRFAALEELGGPDHPVIQADISHPRSVSDLTAVLKHLHRASDRPEVSLSTSPENYPVV